MSRRDEIADLRRRMTLGAPSEHAVWDVREPVLRHLLGECERLGRDHLPHMCRLGHPIIRHADSGTEQCPLCDARAECERLERERDTARAEAEALRAERDRAVAHSTEQEALYWREATRAEALQAERDALRGMLSLVTNHGLMEHCPACHSWTVGKHAPDCELAALLGQPQEPKP